MIVKLTFKAEKNIILPFSYGRIIQAVLYSMINEDSFAAFIHDRGYSYDKRSYKLFSFSDIQPRPIKKLEKSLVYPPEVMIYISSVDNEFLSYVLNTFLEKEQKLYFGNTEVRLTGFENVNISLSSCMKVRAMSPVTIYTTFTEPIKKTHFYSPLEKEFSQLIKNNLVKKYISYYGEDLSDAPFEIKPIGRQREVFTTYKGFITKGYKGYFEISGDIALIKMAFDAGIGGKNAQGHGLILPV